mgnify:CR=1 FL=1
MNTETKPYGDPVTTVAELDKMDLGEIIDGYHDGLDGAPEPKGNRSKSYWHGWRNGTADRTVKPDEAQIELVRDIKRNREP